MLQFKCKTRYFHFDEHDADADDNDEIVFCVFVVIGTSNGINPRKKMFTVDVLSSVRVKSNTSFA